MELYGRAQDEFDAVMASVRKDQWDLPSTCELWSVRDVAGHVIWAQGQLREWATGVEYGRAEGAPGAPAPRVLTGADPMATWRAARAETLPVLTEEALARTTTITGIGEVPVAFVVTLLTVDTVAHTWDIGHALGMDVRIDPQLVAVAFGWARAHIVRAPGYFEPEVTPPEGADEQTRMLAYLGRVAWSPVPA